jgi:hypothetical protein
MIEQPFNPIRFTLREILQAHPLRQIRSLNGDPDARIRFLSDPRFMTLLEVRIGYKSHITGEYQVALDAVNRILEQIEASR